jgi:hypothetical protein
MFLVIIRALSAFVRNLTCPLIFASNQKVNSLWISRGRHVLLYDRVSCFNVRPRHKVAKFMRENRQVRRSVGFWRNGGHAVMERLSEPQMASVSWCRGGGGLAGCLQAGHLDSRSSWVYSTPLRFWSDAVTRAWREELGAASGNAWPLRQLLLLLHVAGKSNRLQLTLLSTAAPVSRLRVLRTKCCTRFLFRPCFICSFFYLSLHTDSNVSSWNCVV